jgi:DNA adenine methylase
MNPPLKIFGGKHYLAKRIVECMPPHKVYVEPYAGGLSVLLAKDPEGVSEVVNDLDGDLTNFWEVLQSERDFEKFLRIVEAMPFSEYEWGIANKLIGGEYGEDECVFNAVDFFVNCRQSLGGMGKSFAPLSKNRTRRGMSEQASAWLTAVEGLPLVHARLKRVVVLNRDALDVIRQQDTAETLFYCDSPYHPSTRTAKDVYTFEMTHADHVKYLEAVMACKGKVMVSGYRCELYDTELSAWRREDFDSANHAAKSGTKRKMVESLWMNF